MMFKLGARSLANLSGVHPDLVKVVKKAIEITLVDFVVTEGLRTYERQQQLFKSGATKTMNSRHLTGHAVDLAPIVGGKAEWRLCPKVASAMKLAAAGLRIPLEWGGDWKTFIDQPHFQLTWKDYPAKGKADA